MDVRRAETRLDLLSLELRLLAPSRSLAIGAIGGALAILFYKICELLVRGFMGEGFQLTPPERVTTIILLIVTATLISLVPSSRRELRRLQEENDQRLRELAAELERIDRERT